MKYPLIILISFALIQPIFAKTVQPPPPKNLTKLLATQALSEPLRGKNPEFFIRGVITNYQELGKSQYKVTFLPIEVLSNRQHYVTFDRFQNGLDTTLTLTSKSIRHLKKGNVAELNQYYIVHEEGKGNAKLIALEFRQDFQAYPASAAPYLNKPDLLEPQLTNALKGLLLFEGSLTDNTKLKDDLDRLGKHPNKTLATLAINARKKIFNNGASSNLDFWGPLKRAQMQGARKDATGAYMEIREDRGFAGNAADGSFLEVPS